MAEKCHRTGKTIYPMDNPIRIGNLVFSKAGFTCAASGAPLTLKNYVMYEGEVYHPNHVPKAAPDGSAGLPLNVAHAISSQATSSSAKVNDKKYTGTESSGFNAIPEHVLKAKKEGSGFSGTRAI